MEEICDQYNSGGSGLINNKLACNLNPSVIYTTVEENSPGRDVEG